MCSIFGYISQNQPDENVLRGLSDMMSHRGPDASGYFSDKNIFLGHNRLAIIDTSVKANQPMCSDNEQFILIFNGEIYNHIELRKKLDYQFKTHSDTETLLQLLIHFGKDILPELNGIFSFAFYDTDTGNVLIARDYAGVKPLYYIQQNKTFVFASEIKSLLPLSNKIIEENILANYLSYTYNPDNKSIYTDINIFPSGSYIELNVNKIEDNIEFQTYFKYQIKVQKTDEKQSLEKLENLLLESVERQLLADVPIGMMLSGGLDSASILALAKTVNPSLSINCYSIKQDDLSSEGFENDLYYAQLMAKKYKEELQVVDGKFSLEELTETLKYLVEPSIDIAPYYVYKISEHSKNQNIKVLLSGAGADEIWGGYRRHLQARYQSLVNLSPKFIKNIAEKRTDIPFFRRLNKALNVNSLHWHQPEQINSFFKNKNIIIIDLKENLNKNLHPLDAMLELDFNTYLQRHNLLYNDKMAMAHGVEVRVPLIDLELVKFSESIPYNLKVKGITGKYLFRKVMEKYLPKEIINRSKTGFGAPVRKLVKEDWNQQISELPQLLNSEIFDLEAIKKSIEINKTGKEDLSYALLGLYIFSRNMNNLSQ